MLPASTASSIQKRRQHHRRQQSLEVPILAAPLPHQHRRTNPGHRQGHRRGLSLDQSLSAMTTPSGFRPLVPQDMAALAGGPHIARTQHPDTNIAFPPDQQHLIKQETQEHSIAQPGYQQAPPPSQAGGPPDFQSHLHQQLNGIFNPSVSGPHPEQAAAMQQLQHHMMWYEQNFGNSSPTNPNPNSNIQQPAPFVQVSHPVAGDMAAPVFLSQAQVPVMPATPMSHSQAQTVPSTPQNHAQSWPSPPPSHSKHQRSQSYQLDVAPMPPNHDPNQFPTQGGAFANGSFNFSGEQDYAGSAYSSSVVDASSPPHQHSTPMPTLFEETTPEYVTHGGHPGALMYQAAGGAEQDFNSPHFMMGGGPICPEQAALDAAGIDATYIDTGISEEQINSWLVHPTGKGDAYRCKWEGCNTKINRKENARSHVQNHLDDRRFRCNPCGKRFNRLHDTKRHHLTHTNERPAICPCGKTFARADALTRHRQRDMCEGVLPGFEKLEEDKPKRGRPKKDRSGGGDKSKKSSRPDIETRMKKASLARAMDAGNGDYSFAASTSSAPSECSMPHTPPQDHDGLEMNDILSMDGGSTQFNTASNTWLDTPPTSPPSATQMKSSSKIFIDLSIPEEPESVSPSKLSTRSSPCPNGNAGASSVHGSPTRNGNNSIFADHSSPSGFASGSFHGDSSPMEEGVDIFNDAVNFDVLNSHPDVGKDVFSPPGESCSGSSVYNSDWDTVHIRTVKGVSSAMPSTMYSDNFNNIPRNPYSLEDFMGSGEEEQYNEVRDMLDSWVASH